ncbi:MAG: adenylate/guanylate cyclase domain-containing protein [Ilumatobacter sp.]|uniref:ATP-binding protein n=1 Tax=Ilumatobacter sp. TaxID=1967498 RepID=UPI002624A65F|nr:adenylate/guanylate cyclase domain-containing protein [Ilumatobacter sp.]MDJ0768756.1 adenylate/guanylate cyclase domain-containing protein [Ilumatobacter sp.]
MDEREQLRIAIAAQEQLRGTVPDEVVDATIATLEERRTALSGPSRAKRRKLITVLFADVSGSTALGETLDPEELSDRFDALWKHLDGVIERFGGRIDKHIGDAVMGLWGADQAREDDPERAIRAALEMQSMLSALRDEAAVPELTMRIGVNTGPVVLGAIASTDEFTAMGDTVNVAARLERAAPEGAVLVGHDTYRHVRGVFSVRVQEPLEVKGKRASLRTYLVEGVRPRAFRLPSRGIEGVETDMIGRRQELERLQQALSTTIEASAMTSLAIVGDAGIGKSRLLYEFEDWLRVRPGEVRLFTGRADHGRQGVPYSLIRDLLFARFEIAEDDPGEIALAKLAVGFRELAGQGAAADAPWVGHLIGVDVDVDALTGADADLAGTREVADRAALAIGRLLTRAAVEMPIVVLIEDLHWADRASLDLLARVRREVAASPVLVVTLSRPTEPIGTPTRADPDGIFLGPLSPTESEELVDEVLKSIGAVPPEPRQRIVEATGGNPFFVEELVRMMVDEGVIVIDGDEWQLHAERLGDLSIPPTVTGVIQARLDLLADSELAALQRAAVVGSVFWDAAIPKVASSAGVAPADLDAALDTLASRDLIQRQSTSVFTGTVEYHFTHAILREVTYETVLRQDRPDLHRAVADWMASRSEASASASTIAGHYASGGAVSESAQWFARAANQARTRHAIGEAIDACRSALEPEILDAATTMRVLDDLCESLTIAAQYDEALDTAQEMERVAASSGDERDVASALLHQSHLHIRTGRSREALDVARRANALLRRGDAAAEALVDSMIELGWGLLRLGDAHEAVAQGIEALGIIEGGTSPRSLRGVRSMLGAAHLTLGHYAEAAVQFTEALALDRGRGDRRGEAANLINLGEVARLQGELRQAIEMLGDAVEIVREIGDLDQEALALNNLGGALVEVGDTTVGVAHLEDAVRAATRTGGTEHSSETHRFLAEAHLALGDDTRAEREVRTALQLAQQDENPDHLGHGWRVLGLVAASRGRPIAVPGDHERLVGAEECLERSASVFAGAAMERDRALALADRAAVAAAAGDQAASTALRDEARTILADLDLTHLLDLVDQRADR